ncbi:MAG: hypothetical protein IPG01_15820 [Chitinophagaceae bacterium]|nr:hypothetical protein [Chitinophagaceae bacterium]
MEECKPVIVGFRFEYLPNAKDPELQTALDMHLLSGSETIEVRSGFSLPEVNALDTGIRIAVTKEALKGL